MRANEFARTSQRMMRRPILFTILLLLFPGILGWGQVRRPREQEKPEKDRSAADAHSFVELFSKLENNWVQAEQRRDSAALDAILAPEFSMIRSEHPETPVSRAEWMQRALHVDRIQYWKQHAMNIRAFLNVAVVSFVQSQKAMCDGSDCSGEYLIVDVWEASHGQWKVAERYISPVLDHSIRYPEVRQN